MELQTRYVTSGDGTRIAISTLGQGRPLVIVQEIWLTAMETYWAVPEIRENLERLAQRRTVVRFDHRGIGLSEREVTDISLDARVSDLVAVVTIVALRTLTYWEPSRAVRSPSPTLCAILPKCAASFFWTLWHGRAIFSANPTRARCGR